MNVAICGSRFIAVSVNVPFLFKEVFSILGQNLFQTQIRALYILQKAAILTFFIFLNATTTADSHIHMD